MAIDGRWRIGTLVPIAFMSSLLAGCAFAPSPGSYGPGGSSGSGIGAYTVGSPYEISGIWYYPEVDYNYDRTGIASWYGADFDGKYTANGEIYDMNGLTAAHTTLPLPSVVEVTDLQNGRSLQLRVNDRGPFVDGRLIDVSRRAAQLLGFEVQGTAPVRVRILKRESIAAAEEATHNGGEIVAAATDAAAAAPPVAAPPPAPTPVRSAVPPPAPRPRSAPASEPEVVAAATPASRISPPPIYADAGTPPARMYIQAGAFSLRDNAQRVQWRIARLGSVRVTTASVNGIELYRVRLGPVANAAQADRLLARVVNSGYPEARIVGD
jgi:rare lipoprotein A